MISPSILSQVLADNRKLVESKKIFPREITIGDFPRCVLVGVRRSGKSYLLYQKIQELLACGKTWDDMLYLNFEDERLMGFDASDFNRILSVHAEMSGSEKTPILFLDEIQLIDGWEKFARRMADAEAEIYITGSNAKMLSVDVAAALGGRFLTVNVYPLSFPEVLGAKGLKTDNQSLSSTVNSALIKREFESFFQYGGFPESLNLPNKIEYLNILFQKIYLGDIAVRNKINNIFPLRILIKKIAESVGQPLSYSRLTNIVTALGVKLSKNTSISYVQYGFDSCLLFPIKNIVGKLQDREGTHKIYFVDNGLITLLNPDPTANLLENLVAITLIRKYGLNDSVFFYKRDIEVDFYLAESETAIQVSVDLERDPKTLDRELNAFKKMGKEVSVKHRVIITLNEEKDIETEFGPVKVVPIWKWLLKN